MRKQYLALLVSRGLGGALSALTFVIVARLSGVTAVGQLGSVTGALTFLYLLADFGMSTYIPRERAREQQARVLVGLRLNMLTSVVFGAIASLVLLGLGLHGDLNTALVLLAISLALEKNTDTALAVAIADGLAWLSASSIVIRGVLTLAIFWLLYLFDVEPVAAFCGGSLTGALVAQIQVRFWLSRAVAREGDRLPATEVIRGALPFFVSNVTAGIKNLDIALVTATNSVATAGTYTASSRLLQPFFLIPVTLTHLVVPHAARQDADGVRKLVRNVLLFFGGLLIGCFAAAASAPWAVGVLLGPKFEHSGGVLALLLIGMPFVALSSPLGSVLQGQQRERFVGINGVIFAVLFVVLVAGGGYLGGGEGAAIGVAVTYVLKCASLLMAISSTLRHSGKAIGIAAADS